MDDKTISIYYQLILDTWKALKTDLQHQEDDQVWWDQLIQKYARIGDKYRGTRAEAFAAGILVNCLNEIEREWKRGREGK